MPESEDRRPHYLIVVTKGRGYVIQLSSEQMECFWHVWNTTIKQVGRAAGSPRSAAEQR